MDSVINGINNGSNGWMIAVLCLVIIVMVIVGAKHGLIQVKTNKLRIGENAMELEREIIRRQADHAKLTIEGLERDIPKIENYDEFRAKFILEKLYDEIIKWITQNHITNSEQYVKLKQKAIVSIIKKNTVNDLYISDEFIDNVKKNVIVMINDLIDIRKEFTSDEQIDNYVKK